jgi:hypothetical protein
VGYQGDLIEATLDSEPIGEGGVAALHHLQVARLHGHIYGMGSEWNGCSSEAVDAELARVEAMLEERYPGESS